MSRLTRAELLSATSRGAAALFLGEAASAAINQAGATAAGRGGAASVAAAQPRSFRSRPDVRPPAVRVTGAGRDTSAGEGYLFLAPTRHGRAPAGPLIVDSHGEPVWFRPLPASRWASNFRVQVYRGEPVLTWWEGVVHPPGYGRGEGVILDGSYRELARVRAAHGRHVDLHEVLLTPAGTALITCYPQAVHADLSAVGGPRDGQVLDSVIQEIDVRTGRLLFEWRGLDHVPVSESYLAPGGAYDYLHANSIDLTPDGMLLVSARHTCAVYKLDRRTGRVIWRLGGKRSDFAMGKGTPFAWQHDARHQPGGRITLFDDGAGPRKTESRSRGVVLDVNHSRRTVRLVREYGHPSPLLAYAMGNMQTLPDGNVLVGWGNVPALTEFTPAGRVIVDVWTPWAQPSYRGFRLPWSGAPAELPALTASANSASGARTLYASWNGATDVASWQVALGPSATALRPAAVVQRTGFEATIPLGTASGYAAVTALDAAGRSLASSEPIRL